MYENSLIQKPWGYEYLIYENDNVGIWFLHINYGHQTSFHGHPCKKTGYIILSGVAEVSFFDNTIRLIPPEKLVLRTGVFHATKAISKCGMDLIEIETPKNKDDIIRFEDPYGRAGKPYNTNCTIEPSNDIMLITEVNKNYQIGDCEVRLIHSLSTNYETSMIKQGGLKYQDYDILACGDIVNKSMLKKCLSRFKPVQPSAMIGVNY